jgi:hypothetical protein
LLSLSDRSGIAGYQQNKEDLRAVSELAEALRDAIVEYQVSIAHWPAEFFADIASSLRNKWQSMNRILD